MHDESQTHSRIISLLSEWFQITFDASAIKLDVHPPGSDAWSASIAWNSIVRVCFKAADLFESDEIYIFTKERPESYLIPMEAGGGFALWEEILSRKLFDAGVAIKAATATDEIFCWPEGA